MMSSTSTGDSYFVGLELFDLSDLTEACLAECEIEHVATASKAVLLGFEDAASFEVLVFLLDREVHVRIDHVLKLVGPCHLARLVDLIDDQADSTGFLTEVSDLL